MSINEVGIDPMLRVDAARELEVLDRSTFPRITAWKILNWSQLYIFYIKNAGAGELGVTVANVILSIALVFKTDDLTSLAWYQTLVHAVNAPFWTIVWLALTTLSVFAFVTGHVRSRKLAWRSTAVVWCAMFGAVQWYSHKFGLLQYLMLDIGLISAVASTRLRDIERIHNGLRQRERDRDRAPVAR